MPDPKDTSKTQRLKKVLWESTLNAPIRGAYNLMNSSYEDLVGGDAETTERIAGDSLSAAGGVTAGSAFVPKPRGAITMGANRRGGGGSAPRPARGVKQGSMRQQALDNLKQGPKKPTEARDVGSGSMRQKTLDSLKQGPKKPEKAADVSRGSARAEALKEARMANRGATRKPRPGEKKFIGPTNKPQPGERKFIGPSNKPQPGDKRFIGPSGKPRSGDKNFIGPNPRTPRAGDKNFVGPKEKPRSGDADFIGPNPRAPKAGDKNFVGPTKPRTFGSMSRSQKLALGAGAAGTAAMLYRGADKPSAQKRESPRDDRASSGSDKAAKFKAKRQGMNTPGSPTNPNKATPKKTGDKSRAAAKPEKKMSNFERMKQRQYEKEGYGGRAMTSRGAESRVKQERSYKFKDLFSKKKR